MSGPNHPRGTSNANERGSSHERRRRKQWLLDTFGDGETAPCSVRWDANCLLIVTIATLTVDRIKPGVDGGTYARDNIQPACGPCNSRHGTALREARRAAILGAARVQS